MRSTVFVFILSCAAMAQSTPDGPSKLPRHEEQVVVTGSYAAVPLEEADRSVGSIEIGQSPTEFRNWVDALQQDPSLDVQQRAPGTSADLSVRGTTFEETLILVNGLRLNDVQTGHNNLDIPFPFESVRRVEVLKGAGSTLYGSDAMGGAVNFITAVPESSEVRLGAGAGNFGTNLQNGALTLVRKRFSEELSFVRELSTGFIADRDYRNLAVASESHIPTPLGSSDILLGISDRPFGAAGFYGVSPSIPSWERSKGWLAAWTQPLGARTAADFAYRRHTDEYVYVKPDPSLYENNHIGEDYQAALRSYSKLGENLRLYYGADALREHIDSTNLGIHTRDQGGVYASFDARALKRFSFNVGAREELYTAGQQVFSPSVSGAYWLSHRVKLRGSISHAFRLPDYTELYYSDPVHRGNPNLAPEHSWSYEGGAQLALARGITLDADVFYHRDSNVIDYVLSESAPAGTPYTAENIQKLNFTGAEIDLRWQLAKQQRIELSYTGIHGAGASLTGLYYLYAFNFPSNAGAATWWSRLPGKVDSRLRVTATQRYPVAGPPQPYPFNSQDVYPLVEWMVARDFRYWKPYLQLTNLTDTKYHELAGVAMPGRGFIAGMELRWKGK
jgi:iron complex outermembrane receptor protein